LPLEFRNLLTRMFNSFIQHCYIPKEMLFGEIRPNRKGKCKSQSDSENYRPIMNSVNLLKVFECFITEIK